MREIKFRAWYGEKIGMLEPSFNGNINEIFADKNGIYMQYTGLKDENGVEIYEGDIVRYKERNLEKAFNLTSGGDDFIEKTKKIWFRDQSFNVPEGFIKDLEVIGNIYENPELV